MWNFLPGGLLMPSAVPMNLADPKFTNNGEFDLQVRGRVRSHLENFIRDYMEPGTYSDIQMTPEMDYNCRFYTTRDHYAWAMGKAIADIDYEKFKPTAEDKDPKTGKPLYADGREYHTVLNSIWSTVTRLGAPGGLWGKWSTTNPNGYKSAKDSPYGSYGSYTYRSSGSGSESSTQPTMGEVYRKGESGWGKVDDVAYASDDLTEAEPGDRLDFGEWYNLANKQVLSDLDPDFIAAEEVAYIKPGEREAVRDALLEELSAYNIPIEDWRNYLSAAEWDVISDDYDKFLAEVNRQRRKVRKARRRERKARIQEQNS